MSASQCVKCERWVGGYEKYCEECIKTYGVKQDGSFWKTHSFVDWEAERKLEFAKDMVVAAYGAQENKSTSAPPPARKRHKKKPGKS